MNHDTSAPREFWIEFPDKPDGMISIGRIVSSEDFDPLDEYHTVHVIEKRALDEALAEVERLKVALACAKEAYDDQRFAYNAAKEQYGELKAECERLKAICSKEILDAIPPAKRPGHVPWNKGNK